jgi:hypothetical protein
MYPLWLHIKSLLVAVAFPRHLSTVNRPFATCTMLALQLHFSRMFYGNLSLQCVDARCCAACLFSYFVGLCCWPTTDVLLNIQVWESKCV